jgi:hypothetical protein
LVSADQRDDASSSLATIDQPLLMAMRRHGHPVRAPARSAERDLWTPVTLV